MPESTIHQEALKQLVLRAAVEEQCPRRGVSHVTITLAANLLMLLTLMQKGKVLLKMCLIKFDSSSSGLAPRLGVIDDVRPLSF